MSTYGSNILCHSNIHSNNLEETINFTELKRNPNARDNHSQKLSILLINLSFFIKITNEV